MSNIRCVDHVVVGVGGIGAGVAYWLAKLAQDTGRKATIVGLEQFALGHDKGASHDHSRIIRYSYHTPEYVKLASEAYETWDAVASEAGEQLVVRTGGVDLFLRILQFQSMTTRRVLAPTALLLKCWMQQRPCRDFRSSF